MVSVVPPPRRRPAVAARPTSGEDNGGKATRDASWDKNPAAVGSRPVSPRGVSDFGRRRGVGSTSGQLEVEEPSVGAYDGNNQGGYPTVQLMENSGQAAGIVGGVSEAFGVFAVTGLAFP
jgi:hypothetical protein